MNLQEILRRRGIANREFADKHKNADLIIFDIKTKEPIEARYHNKTSIAYHREETRDFFRTINAMQDRGEI